MPLPPGIIGRGMLTASGLTVYTRPECSYSGALLAELDRDGVPYAHVDLTLAPERETELLELTNGERITPVMVEGGVVTVGFHGIG